MELAKIKVDAEKIEQGNWVSNIPDLGDIRLKVRSPSGALYRRRQAELIRKVPLMLRQNEKEMAKVSDQLLIDVVLMDWDGLLDDGKPVPYSKEIATKLITDPDYVTFKDGVMWASSIVSALVAETVAADGKNSQTP